MDDEPDLNLAAHRFSMEALEVAKAFVAGTGDRDELKAQAAAQLERLPQLSARIPSVPDAERPDINRALADAALDLQYVVADGKVPSSIRLHHILAGG